MIYVCGHSWKSPDDDAELTSTTTAAIMQMNDDGIVNVMYAFGNQDVAVTDTFDACRAVYFDEDKNEAAFLLEVTSPDLRPDYYEYNDYSAANTDVTIVWMSSSGYLTGAHNINY
jgi:hypothetical protein